jgi:hypothetical protein
MLDQVERELLRAKILARLARRQAFSYPTSAIARALRDHMLVDFEVSDDQVEEACVFLEGIHWLKHECSPVGATKMWQATSAGVLECERRGLRE